MSSGVSSDPYPVMVVQDRYQGVYSSGRWWAVANADHPLEGTSRIAWLMECGPGSDDVSASEFWRDAPTWIAAGDTPDMAVARLVAQAGATEGGWAPPPVDADPR